MDASRGARRATCRTARFSVMLIFSLEHRVDPGPQSGFLSQLDQELQSLVDDAVFRVIEVKAGGLYGETLAALSIVREELAEM